MAYAANVGRVMDNLLLITTSDDVTCYIKQGLSGLFFIMTMTIDHDGMTMSDHEFGVLILFSKYLKRLPISSQVICAYN